MLFSLLYSYWYIHFKFLLVSNFQLYRFLTIFICATTFRFFIYYSKSLEEERLDRSKFREYLRADVCKYRPEVGKIKFLKNPQKIMYTTLGILVMKI